MLNATAVVLKILASKTTTLIKSRPPSATKADRLMKSTVRKIMRDPKDGEERRVRTLHTKYDPPLSRNTAEAKAIILRAVKNI